MNYTLTTSKKTATLKFADQCDALIMPAHTEEILGLIKRDHKIICDFSDTIIITGSWLRLVDQLAGLAKSSGIEVSIVGANENIWRIVGILNLKYIMPTPAPVKKTKLTPKLLSEIKAYTTYRFGVEQKLMKQEDKLAVQLQQLFPKACGTLDEAVGWVLEFGNGGTKEVLQLLQEKENAS